MTRKIILYIATSIDGFIADSKGGIDWLGAGGEATEVDTSYEDFYGSVDTVVMGRTTYDQVVNELAPGNYPYADVDSYVLTSRPTENSEKIVFTSKEVTQLVEELKMEEGGNIWIVGGSSVVMPLMKENLIDEYQLAIVPIILGEGIRLFQEFSPSLQVTTTEVSTVNGLVYTKYVKR